MTQIFAADGTVTPVTVIKAGPCVVVQRRQSRQDGYDAVQLGLVEDKSQSAPTSRCRVTLQKAGIPPTEVLRSFVSTATETSASVGDKVLVDQFSENDIVDVIGTSKGRGFAGRHQASRLQPAAESRTVRCSIARRVRSVLRRIRRESSRARACAGHMGVERKTIKNLRVVRVNAEKNLILDSRCGAGSDRHYVLIKKTK